MTQTAVGLGGTKFGSKALTSSKIRGGDEFERADLLAAGAFVKIYAAELDNSSQCDD